MAKKSMVKFDKSIDDVIIKERMSELVFKRHMLIDILNNYITQDKTWYEIYIRRKPESTYECKTCKDVVSSGDRLCHFATAHYGRYKKQ